MKKQKQCIRVKKAFLERDSEKTLTTEEEKGLSIQDKYILIDCSQEIDLQIQDMDVYQYLTAIVLEGKIVQPDVIDHNHKMIFQHPHSLNALLVNVKLALQTQKRVRKLRDLSQKNPM